MARSKKIPFRSKADGLFFSKNKQEHLISSFFSLSIPGSEGMSIYEVEQLKCCLRLPMWCMIPDPCCSQEDLDVRLGFDLCVQEQDFIRKRKKVAAAALKDILQLEEDLQDDEVSETRLFSAFCTDECQNIALMVTFLRNLVVSCTSCS